MMTRLNVWTTRDTAFWNKEVSQMEKRWFSIIEQIYFKRTAVVKHNTCIIWFYIYLGVQKAMRTRLNIWTTRDTAFWIQRFRRWKIGDFRSLNRFTSRGLLLSSTTHVSFDSIYLGVQRPWGQAKIACLDNQRYSLLKYRGFADEKRRFSTIEQIYFKETAVVKHETCI